MTTSRYAPLTVYLRKSGRAEIPITFDDLEEVIGSKLPPSASTHRAWFSNNPTSNPMTRAWLAAGYRSADVDMAKRKLVFRKIVSEQPAAEPREIAGSMPTAAELREIAGMPERQASLQELESKLDSYIHDVENGTTVVVSRDGRQVARIIPETNSAEQKRAALKASGTFDWSGRRPKSRRPSVRLRDGGSLSDSIINERR